MGRKPIKEIPCVKMNGEMTDLDICHDCLNPCIWYRVEVNRPEREKLKYSRSWINGFVSEVRGE